VHCYLVYLYGSSPPEYNNILRMRSMTFMWEIKEVCRPKVKNGDNIAYFYSLNHYSTTESQICISKVTYSFFSFFGFFGTLNSQ
jgi:hypothetical protein